VKKTLDFPSSSNRIRILLLDRHALMRTGLRYIVDRQENMQVVGESDDCIQALELAGKLQPDIILLDLNLVGQPNPQIITDLLMTSNQSRVILVTGIEDERLHQQAVQMGAMGIILKDQPGDTLLKAIKKVYAGEVWIDRSMMAAVLSQLSRARMGLQEDTEAGKIGLLSKREREVVALIGKGLKNKEIACRLSISEVTVRHHLTSIFNKLGVVDRLELTIYAYRNGLAELPL
jgi:two-component system, NarL family, nitrate/nitrite response regulator NarL